MITPVFYLGCLCVWALGKGLDEEYFFPPLTGCTGNDCDNGASSLWDESVWNIFHIIDFSTISWEAVVKSIPTMIALVMFSLIHVPINIPAFAVSTDVDVDMNVELMAHGYSNGIVGLLGGESIVSVIPFTLPFLNTNCCKHCPCAFLQFKAYKTTWHIHSR